MINRRRLSGVLGSVAGALGVPQVATAQALAQSQVLQFGLGFDDIRSLDPHAAVASSDIPIVSLIYEGLLAFPPGVLGGAELRPALAERWDSSPDKKTWTFHLRRDVRWHGDFGAFSARDVQFSLMRIAAAGSASPFRTTLANLDHVEVADPLTAVVHLKNPDPNFPQIMVNYQAGYIVCRRAVEGGVDLRANTVGTGPFRLQSYQARDKVTLARHDGYWAGRPVLEQVIIHFMPNDSARELALRGNDIDAIELPRRQDVVDRIRRARFTVDVVNTGTPYTMHLNITKAPINDVRVRKALAHGIDRQGLITFLGRDIAQPETSAIAQGYIGHTRDIPQYPHDIARARALLAEAGHPEGFAMEVVMSNSNLYLPIMQVIQDQWRQIGVRVNLRVVDHPTYHRMIRQDLNPVVLYQASRYPRTAQVYLEQFYSRDAAIGRPTAVTNFSHYGEAIPGVDDLLDQARYNTDAEAQRRLWEEAQRRIATDAAAIPLYNESAVLARTRRIDLGFTVESLPFYPLTRTSRMLRG